MNFETLDLHSQLLANVKACGFVEGTPIQNASFELIRDRRDVAGWAQTGTGKTAAYLLPLIDRILKDESWNHSKYVLVLVPHARIGSAGV